MVALNVIELVLMVPFTTSSLLSDYRKRVNGISSINSHHGIEFTTECIERNAPTRLETAIDTKSIDYLRRSLSLVVLR